jgi:hypothetical protein
MVALDRQLEDPGALREHSERLQRLYPEAAADSGKPKELRP